jgi:carbon monoxide dehydrogenase subunit G
MRIEKSVVIARPVEDVWAFLSNLDNVKRWSLSGSEVRQTSPGPLGVGASLEEVKVVLGRFHLRLRSLVVTEFEPKRTIAMTDKRAGIAQPGRQRFTLEPIGEGTRLTIGAEINLKRGLRPFEERLTKLASGGVGRQLANLKRLVESGASSEPS